jgi:hypothetical protein
VSNDQFENAAAAMQDRLTKAVELACLGRGAMQWKAAAEIAADKVVDGTGWEYRLMESIGRPPKAFLTAYDPRRDDR